MLNFLSMNDNIALDVIRTICATFDKAVYYIIGLLYEIIIEVSTVEIFSDPTISKFAGRLYTLVGIFMLFKVSFSVINYIINPDTIFDKETGSGKLIKNIVITFILIIIMPNIFELMGRVQTAILDDHIIENFILGTDDTSIGNKFKISEDCENEAHDIKDVGQYISLVVFRPFYQVDTLAKDYENLLSGPYCTVTSVNNLLQPHIYNSPNKNSVGNSVNGNYHVDYWFIISTLVGGAVALVMVSFAMDIAVRSIKLSFLQIISPIPIISYIDPKQAKSGLFKKWTTELIKTWADLFIRLIALFFVVKIISMIDVSGIKGLAFWIEILIIIGGLMFAKQLPGLIGNMLGIKIDGGFNINPMKRIQKDALGGNLIASAAGLTAGMIGGGIAGAYAGKQVGNVGKGIIGGMLSGANYGRHNPNQAFSKSMDQSYKSLTGNEMARFSLTNSIMSIGGKERVEEIGGYLKTANADLRAEETKLGIASHTSAETGSRLTSKGYNISDLTSLTNMSVNLSAQTSNLESDMNSKESTYNSLRNDLISHEQKYNEAKSFIDNYHSIMTYDDGTQIPNQAYRDYEKFINDYSANKMTLERNLDAAKRNFETAQARYNENKESLRDIDTYLKAIATENESRDKIQRINKTISTLSDEKKQRQIFYHQDSSPKNSVQDAIKQVREHNYSNNNGNNNGNNN